MKKKLYFPIIIAFLSIALVAPLLIEVANAAPVFSDGFESGTLSNWTPYLSSTLSINTTTVDSGLYSVQNNVVGHNENLYTHVLGGSLPNPIHLREYVYITSLSLPSTPGDYYEVGGFASNSGANTGDGEICVFNVAGTLYWGLYYRDALSPNGFSHSISSDNATGTQPVTIGWNCLELVQTTGTTSVPGEEQLYLNGVSFLDVTPFNYDRTPYYAVIGGSQTVTNVNNQWNYFIDDVIVSSSYIGNIQFPLTMQAQYGTVSPGNVTYNKDSTQTITATAPTVTNPSLERYVFLGWTGTGTGSYTGMATSTTVTMGSAITEQALWEHDYYLTVSSANGAATGTGWYSAATSAFASVTPTTVAGSTGTQYVFTSWSGDASGTSSTSNAIIMNGPKAATANWKTQYYLTVSSANGTVGGSGWYDSGTSASSTLSSLTVAGTTGTQYVFTSWSGNAAGTSTPSNAITMDGPKTATANWQTQYNVTLTQSGVGSDFTNNFITVNGTTYNGNGYTTWANASDAYTFSYAPQLLVAANSKQCLLTGVTGNSSALSFVASAPTTVNGTYKTQYYLTTTTAYSSPSQANGWYDNGTSLSAFVASPVSTGSGTQYVCSGWSGDGSIPTSGSASALGFTITAPSTITWNWKTQYLVTFAVSPSGTGSTSPSGTNTWQDAGVISISGTPAYNYKFASWTSDSGSSIDNSLIGTTTATITGPTTITANFAVLPAATATPAPTHTATPTPTHTATPTPTASPTAKPTNASSPTSSPSNSTQNFNATPYIIGAVIAIIIVAILSSFMLLRKTRAKKGLS